jgi:phosphoribosylamine--glycine ligase
MHEVIEPSIRGMAADGTPFTGFLYAGLMISADGDLKVLEFNVRFGDPETQPVLMRLQSCLAGLCLAAVQGRLEQAVAKWDERAALGVVMAAGGYPGSYDKGHIIHGLDSQFPDHVKVFHAGTAISGDEVITSGGRVLCVTALGDSVAEAAHEAYLATGQIHWRDDFHRSDIGWRAIRREQNGPSGTEEAD